MSYRTHGAINENLLALFPSADGHSGSHMKPMCGWRDLSGVVRCGTWLGEWEKIERAWAYDTWGKWQGMPPTLVQANGLEVANITPIVEANDPVYRVASATAFTLTWKKRLSSNWNVGDGTGVIDGRDATVTVYKCTDGTIVFTTTNPTVPLAMDALADGSYIVYVQYLGVKEGLRLPPGYFRDARYNYTTTDGRLSHYNPYVQVGEVPADANNPLNVLRRQLIATNENEDVFAYSAFLTSEAGTNGDGSAIKIHVGSGSWAIGDGVFATPARALCELDFNTADGDSPSTIEPIQFDPLAYVVSRALHTRKDGIWEGKVLLGGGRFSGSGARPSLWQWNDDGTATLLATTEEACDPYCEQMLSTGLVTELVELQDGSIIMLTLCSRHKYDVNGATVHERLPRWPLAVNGEPGGQAMTAIGSGLGTSVIHTTEHGAPDAPPIIASGDTVSFYNQLVDVHGDTITGAPGTLANVDGCLWRHHGKTYGVACNGDPTLEVTRERVTFFDGLWNDTAPQWSPALLVLQRGASINGNNVIFGWEPTSETAQVIIDDGISMKVVSCNYRVRAGTVTNNADDPNLQSCIMPAKKVIAADGETPQHLDVAWSLIETNGSDGNLPAPDPLDDIESGDGRFIRYGRDNTQGMQIHSYQVRDMMASQALRAANADPNETSIGVRLRVDSTADLDDVSSYIWRPLLDRRFTFPVAANSKVEMIIVTKSELAPEQLPEVGANG